MSDPKQPYLMTGLRNCPFCGTDGQLLGGVMEKWISVDDCYPVIDHMGYLVLFIMQDKLDQEIMIGEWNEKTELWETEMSWSGGVGKKYVTHWMPLPSPPMEVQE